MRWYSEKSGMFFHLFCAKLLQSYPRIPTFALFSAKGGTKRSIGHSICSNACFFPGYNQRKVVLRIAFL
jgi:hypothetical protein